MIMFQTAGPQIDPCGHPLHLIWPSYHTHFPISKIIRPNFDLLTPDFHQFTQYSIPAQIYQTLLSNQQKFPTRTSFPTTLRPVSLLSTGTSTGKNSLNNTSIVSLQVSVFLSPVLRSSHSYRSYKLHPTDLHCQQTGQNSSTIRPLST